MFSHFEVSNIATTYIAYAIIYITYILFKKTALFVKMDRSNNLSEFRSLRKQSLKLTSRIVLTLPIMATLIYIRLQYPLQLGVLFN